MKAISPEKQQELDGHLNAAARIMYEHTEPNKLKNFESIEWELREQILSKVSPKIAEFFLERKREDVGKQRTLKSFLGEVTISQNQGKKLGLKPKVHISPGLEKCCLRLCANSSYSQAEKALTANNEQKRHKRSKVKIYKKQNMKRWQHI